MEKYLFFSKLFTIKIFHFRIEDFFIVVLLHNPSIGMSPNFIKTIKCTFSSFSVFIFHPTSTTLTHSCPQTTSLFKLKTWT